MRRTRRVFLVALTVVGCLLVLEVGSYFALWARDGSWPHWQRWREEREAAAGAAWGGGADGSASRFPARFPGWPGEVLHPYLGFVLDPQEGSAPDDRPPDDRGLTDPLGAGGASPPDELVVGIFGGSVARAFAISGGEALSRALAGSALAAGRTPRIRNFAVRGYKQPQQLLALNYALALGERLDVVIALDGFNDIVLPSAENLRQGIFPFYPRGWAGRIEGVLDAPRQLLVGEIAFLRARRGERSPCSGALGSRSAVCHLLWTTADRRLAGRIGELQEALVSLAPLDAGFVATGPSYGARDSELALRETAEFWGRCSTLMQQICRQRGIAYHHFLQPNQYVAGSKRMSRAERLVALDPAKLYRPYAEAGYPFLVEVGQQLARQDVSFHDLTMVFAEVPEPIYVDACCHLNQRGNEILARVIADRIVGSGGAAP